jgi:tRNA(Ser,Leu) C12 N-acetylase TAN1
VRDIRDLDRTRLERRTRVERVDVRQQHEQVGLHELRDERGEPVVVAEPDLVGRDGVVLVDDRQDPQVEEALHGALRVAAVRRVLEVSGGQQHLAGHDLEAAQAVLVAVDEEVLPHSRGGLLRREVGRPRVEVEERDAGRDRA